MSRASPGGFNDPEELLPMCYKCSNYSSHLRGNRCPTCQEEFVFSFVSFGKWLQTWLVENYAFLYDFYLLSKSTEILPLVQFHPETDIDAAEAERLLLAPPKTRTTTTSNGNQKAGDADANNVPESVDFNFEDIGNGGDGMLPLTLDRIALRAIDPDTVLIARWPAPLRARFYRNLLPELLISICAECLQPFHAEDFELQLLQRGHCPFCRTPAERLLNNY